MYEIITGKNFEQLKENGKNHLSESLLASGVKSGDLFDGIGVLYKLLFVGVIVLIPICLLMMLCCRKKLFEKVKKIWKEMVWNGIIIMLSLGYTKNCV